LEMNYEDINEEEEEEEGKINRSEVMKMKML